MIWLCILCIYILNYVNRKAILEMHKGTWRMPWLSQAMKDVTSCDKPRVGANGH